MSKDGGQAFPRASYGKYSSVNQEGMSLRDYFAAAAMQAHIEAVGGLEGQTTSFIAAMAYEMADAMVKESKK